MNNIPIFDSLTHPMPNGNWLLPKYDGLNTLQHLLSEMADNNVQWAIACGMGAKVGGYQEEYYASIVRDSSDNLFPVAFFDFDVLKSGISIGVYLRRLKQLGYVGIKIHPRFSSINLTDSHLPELIKEANQLRLAVLLCTYFWSKDKALCSYNPEQLLSLLCQVPNEQVILVHGGAVRLLEVAEIARQFPSVLLDLSLTLCKWEGSSIDMDLTYLFSKFDLRICIGSDSPEFGQADLRRRFASLGKGLTETKLRNIAYKNITNFIETNY